MQISGLQKLSLIDYPGKLSAVIFTQGCNFRCPFCHNPELVLPSYYNNIFIQEDAFFNFLEERKGFIDGLCISGGEPLLQTDIEEFIKRVKNKDFLVKLDTNGTSPEKLENLINKKLIDFIAMDIKSPLEKYSEAAGVNISADTLKKSMNLIISSNIDYEFRTTIVKKFHTKNDIIKIAHLIQGAKKYTLQKFLNRDKILDINLSADPSITKEEVEIWEKECVDFVQKCEIRGWE